ncbi:MAG: CsbD family protein [Planctomycetes bacterium]|nr:CsbD family protein [Planctomycetota bacterium]
MLWNDVTSNWQDLRKEFQVKWSKLTETDLTAINGKRDELVRRLQTAYKTDKVKLEKEVDDFIKSLKAHV